MRTCSARLLFSTHFRLLFTSSADFLDFHPTANGKRTTFTRFRTRTVARNQIYSPLFPPRMWGEKLSPTPRHTWGDHIIDSAATA